MTDALNASWFQRQHTHMYVAQFESIPSTRSIYFLITVQPWMCEGALSGYFLLPFFPAHSRRRGGGYHLVVLQRTKQCTWFAAIGWPIWQGNSQAAAPMLTKPGYR